MWTPKQLNPNGPRYLAIVEALEADIADGIASDGMALAPQRELAFQTGLSVGTVVKAYSVAKQRGLVTGELGRGTFISLPSDLAEEAYFGDGSAHPAVGSSKTIDLSVNVSPPLQATEQIGNVLRSVSSSPNLNALMRYGVHLGSPEQRTVITQWIHCSNNGSYKPSVDQVALCSGAQQAIWAVCSSLVQPGQTVLSESNTFPGIKSAVGSMGGKLVGVELDEHGLCPAALERALLKTNSSLLYLMPTLHNPTGITMPQYRREAIARVIQKYDITVLEDDVYGFLHPNAPAPLAAHVPNNVCYLSSFSKSVAPGLRTGFCSLPPALIKPVEAALRASCWMSSPITHEVAVKLIDSGQIDAVIKSRRDEAQRRMLSAQRVLTNLTPNIDWLTPRFHLWLPCPSDVHAERLVRHAQSKGVLLSSPKAVAADDTSNPGVRICLGNAVNLEVLQVALSSIAKAFTEVLDVQADLSIV